MEGAEGWRAADLVHQIPVACASKLVRDRLWDLIDVSCRISRYLCVALAEVWEQVLVDAPPGSVQKFSQGTGVIDEDVVVKSLVEVVKN